METFKLLNLIRPHPGVLTVVTSSVLPRFLLSAKLDFSVFQAFKSSVVVCCTFFLFCDDAFILFLIALYHYAVCVISLSARQSPMKEQPAPRLPHK